MSLRSANLKRTFWEAGTPAWLILIVLMVLGRSQVGWIAFVVMLFPGLYGALRLKNPDSEGVWRIGYYVGFCLAQGACTFLVLLATAIVLSGLGLSAGSSNSGPELIAYGLAFTLLPLVPFSFIRGVPAIPDALREWGARGIVMRLGGLALGALAFALGYFVYSEPYIGSAHALDPIVKSTVMFDKLDGPQATWEVSDPSVQLAHSGGSLHLTYSKSPTWFYALSRPVDPGSFQPSDGFRLSARSNAATSLFIELEEIGGASYRTWADLPAGEWRTLVFGEPIPFLQTVDTNDQLDWKDIDRVTFAIYVESLGTELWLDNLEVVKFDHTNEYAWFSRKTDHFTIRFHPAETQVIDDVALAAESQYERLVQVLGYRPYGRIPITIVSGHAELEQRQRSNKPVWAIANAFPDWLDILTPRLYSP